MVGQTADSQSVQAKALSKGFPGHAIRWRVMGWRSILSELSRGAVTLHTNDFSILISEFDVENFIVCNDMSPRFESNILGQSLRDTEQA